MDTLFLDANILFSAAYRPTSMLNKLWQLPDTKLVSSFYALEEARRNLNQELHRQHLEKLLITLCMVSSTMDGHFDGLIPTEINLRQKDRPILAAAIAAKAHYLITGDVRDFGMYFGQVIEGVTILPPAAYLKNR